MKSKLIACIAAAALSACTGTQSPSVAPVTGKITDAQVASAKAAKNIDRAASDNDAIDDKVVRLLQ